MMALLVLSFFQHVCMLCAISEYDAQQQNIPQVNDVVLVEKISRASVIRRNDIVFFNPPPVLRQEVANAGGTLNSRDLFVKRVAAVPGDTVTVDSKGRVQARCP